MVKSLDFRLVFDFRFLGDLLGEWLGEGVIEPRVSSWLGKTGKKVFSRFLFDALASSIDSLLLKPGTSANL